VVAFAIPPQPQFPQPLDVGAYIWSDDHCRYTATGLPDQQSLLVQNSSNDTRTKIFRHKYLSGDLLPGVSESTEPSRCLADDQYDTFTM
jgi:hypothetical protein